MKKMSESVTLTLRYDMSANTRGIIGANTTNKILVANINSKIANDLIEVVCRNVKASEFHYPVRLDIIVK